MVLCYICAIAYKYAFGCKMGVSFWGSINIFVGSANELQIANLLGQAKTISYGSSEKRLCVLWISLGYANPTEIIIEPFFFCIILVLSFSKALFPWCKEKSNQHKHPATVEFYAHSNPGSN